MRSSVGGYLARADEHAAWRSSVSHLNAVSTDGQPTPEAWTTKANLAAWYPCFQYAHLVLGQSYRNPAMLAKVAATLQYLTGGHFIVGLGAGGKEDGYRAYGYPLSSRPRAYRAAGRRYRNRTCHVDALACDVQR